MFVSLWAFVSAQKVFVAIGYESMLTYLLGIQIFSCLILEAFGWDGYQTIGEFLTKRGTHQQVCAGNRG